MRKAVSLAWLGVLAAIGPAIAPAGAADLTYFTTVTNTDVMTVDIGQMRGNGTGTLNVGGLAGSTVTHAYLYWAGPTNSADAGANATVSFGGTTITGTNVGFSEDNAWNFLNSQAYRADVTALVTGNGAYSLANFTKPNPTGGAAIAEINGAQLVVFYDDGIAANNHDVVLFNGNDSNFPNSYDATGWNATLNGVNYAGGQTIMTLGVSDGQHFFVGDDGTLKFNGTTIGTGNDFDGTTSQLGNGNPAATGGNGSLWDVRSFDVTALMTSGTNTLTEGLAAPTQGDALGLITAMFALPVGAAPPSDVPEPASWAMFIMGFGVVGGAMRRRRTSAAFA